MPHLVKHASVILHVTHPEGIGAHAEQVLADAATEHVKKLEAAGFEVAFRHTHQHTHG